MTPTVKIRTIPAMLYNHATKAISTLIAVAAIAVALSGTACHQIPRFRPTNTTDFLRANGEDAETITLEVFHIRIPRRQSETLAQLWRESDEQIVPLVTRQAMTQQGFRVGVQGMSLSPTMARLLALRVAKEAVVSDVTPIAGTSVATEITAGELRGEEPLVRMKVVRWYPRNDAPLLIEPYSDSLPEVALFWHSQGRVYGKTYSDAVGVLSLTVQRLSEGAVRIDVTPELHYGREQLTYQRTSETGVTPRMQRPQHPFPELKTSVELLTGQWLIWGMAPGATTGAARCFFSRSGSDVEQKIVAIRVVHVGKPTDTQTDNKFFML